MTIGSIAPVNETKRKRYKQILDERAPLLPSKREEDTGFSEFNGSSFAGAVFNLSTTIAGAGIMALPAAMKVLGLVPGIIMLILMVFLTEPSIEMLLRFSRASKSVTYGGVMNDSFGNMGRILLQVCIIVNNIGVLVVYMIIIGDVLAGTSSGGIHHPGILEGWCGDYWWNGRFFVLLVTTLFVFAPLISFKRVGSLGFTSAFAVGLAVVFVIITAGITFFKLLNGSLVMPRFLPQITDLASIWKLFTVVPVLVTAYSCHYNVHSIDNEMEDSTQIQSVVKTSLLLCSTVYIATSFFCSLLFGEATLDDVLANYDADLGIPYSSIFNDAVRVSYAGHLMLVFPVVFFALRINLDGLVFPSSRPLVLDNRRFTLISISLISIIFLLANFIPSIWDAFQFTGATAAVCIGFIFPAAITLRDVHEIATRRDKMLSIVMIALAVFSNAVAIYSDASSMTKKSRDSPSE